MDIPNHRSLHDTPKPRTGGLAILVAILTGTFVLQNEVDNSLMSVLSYGLVIVLAAFIDDLRSISAFIRLLIQMVCAFLMVKSGLAFETLSLPGVNLELNSFFSIFISIFFIVWFINLYNFMDGMDGFATGMAIIGFSTFTLFALQQGNLEFATVNLIIIVSLIGFLAFNWPPAKIFLGDVGSTLLGILVASLILWAHKKSIFPVWLGILVFLPFFLDATVTLCKRIIRGDKVWQAHRAHYYQRLAMSGLGKKKTLYLEYGWMLGCSMISILLFYIQDVRIQMVIFISFLIFCFTVLFFTDKYINKI